MAPQREWFETDYYAALGVPQGATEKEITRAYRKLAKQYHPDANPGNTQAEDRFKDVSAAYDVLGDPDKRKEYDEVRQMVASGAYAGGPQFRPGPGGTGSTFTFEDLGDAGDLGGMFSNLFGRGGGRRSRTGRNAPQHGSDLETALHLEFLDAVHGITTTVSFTAEAACSVCHGSGSAPGTTPETCPECHGSGTVAVDQGPFSFSQVCPTCGGRGQVVREPCRQCGGRGVEVRPREVKVRIPPGVADGQRIRVKGRGGAGANGGPPGDLYVAVHVRPHPVFGRQGRNLTVTVPVTFPEAALGAQVKVPTLTSPVTVKVKPGTQSGTTVRVRGRGIETAKETGDLLVTFEVAVPTALDDSEREAVEALAGVLTDDPRAHLEF